MEIPAPRLPEHVAQIKKRYDDERVQPGGSESATVTVAGKDFGVPALHHDPEVSSDATAGRSIRTVRGKQDDAAFHPEQPYAESILPGFSHAPADDRRAQRQHDAHRHGARRVRAGA
ncbi:hypothetical protein GCM10010254_24040 [Streptomyces chromofuscus]|nr:hypothetical protein GCM10010254_24040 [Streptomyces chromofuscus]